MDDLEDAALKREIDRISGRVKDIMDKVDALYPPQKTVEEDDAPPAQPEEPAPPEEEVP
jgi:hypothetical protein